MLKTYDITLEVLQKLKQQDFIKDIEIIDKPENVECDLSIAITINKWKNDYSVKVAEIINDLTFEAFKKSGNLITVYYDWKTTKGRTGPGKEKALV